MVHESGEASPLPPARSLPRSSASIGCGGCIATLVGSVFFSLFLMAGAFLIWIATLQPLIRMVEAQSWQAVPCTIVSSEVVGNDTYLIEIHYDYEVDGRPFTGNRYSFFTKKTSGKAAKEKVVEQYPPGLNTTCYVDPANPSDSVLNRNADWNLLWGLFGVPFFAVGLGGMYAFWRRRRKQPAPKQTLDEMAPFERIDPELKNSSPVAVTVSKSDFDDEDLIEEPGPVTLKPESTPLASFVVVLVIALIWNGVVLGFCSSRIPDWIQGKWQWLPELFIIPFAGIGLLLIYGVFHTFLGLFNPIPILTLSRRMIPLGGTAVLSWQYRGSAHSIRKVQVSIKGVEEARYTRGTNTHTDTAVFYEETLFESMEPTVIAQGEVEIRIPTDTMHSFSAKNNKIKWQLKFLGEIPMWPDISSEFSIRVIPHE
ncbi:DUF3592 domain-containing protein [Planctomicrobium sp. SH661]|uniref:DUF3592 domain-containing protein n=1 Tax=Planctomicrobium sp. SH661 TaxID=3448124 RepID=UPI003F5C6CCF